VNFKNNSNIFKIKLASVAKAIYLRIMEKEKTGTIRVSEKLIRDLKEYLAPVGGKIRYFVENAVKDSMRSTKKKK